MRALITGGAGFIGSHLAERLLNQGDQVIALDDLSTGRIEHVAHLSGRHGFECVVDTVTNEPLLGELMHRSDVVFHLAASVGVKLVVQSPIQTIQNNVNGTEAVLRQAARQRTTVIVASTSEVYGNGAALPFREDADLVLGASSKVRWGYATSKLIDEFLALAYWQEQQVPAIVVRLFNCVGPRQSSRYGMVLPNFVRQAIANRPITVHGDGTQTRSFTWVGDVVSALIALANEPRAAGEVFNVGNPTETSIHELAGTVKRMTRSRSAIEFVPYDQLRDRGFEDMKRRVPDIGKLQRLVGYKPAVSLDEIVARTIQYWISVDRPIDATVPTFARGAQLAVA